MWTPESRKTSFLFVFLGRWRVHHYIPCGLSAKVAHLNVRTHAHTRRRAWGCTPWRLVLTWRFDCGLLEKQNGINEVFLFHNADLRTMLFSAWSAFQPMFYCPKRCTLNACRRISREQLAVSTSPLLLHSMKNVNTWIKKDIVSFCVPWPLACTSLYPMRPVC